MKYCNSCGAEINEGAAVCVKCGCAVQNSVSPARKLKTNKGLLKYILLSFVTLGIYDLVVMSALGNDVNTAASRYDGKKTMHFCLLNFLVGPVTLGIAALVWHHRLCDRIDDELRRRGLAYRFSTGSFWGWNILGCLILVGPFIYQHKLCKAMNLLCEDYNIRG